MGKLIKNHWARLIILTAAACLFTLSSHQIHTQATDTPPTPPQQTDHLAASLCAFFWPKILFDWLTKNLDTAVKPVPILQTVNLVLALLTLAYEWPLRVVAGTSIHKSIEVRMLWLPLCSLMAVLMYQGTNPAAYYLLGCAVYFWAYGEGEVICAVPWTLPKRTDRRRAMV